jgi:hypothetical protein
MPTFDEAALALLQRAFPEYEVWTDGRGTWTARLKSDTLSILAADSPLALMRLISDKLYSSND